MAAQIVTETFFKIFLGDHCEGCICHPSPAAETLQN
jgi:hypothetical protein